MKTRLKKAGAELSSLWRQLPYRAANGKSYKMDFANATVLYQITQRMDANTGLRDKVLKFLAQAGVVIDEFRIDPEQAIDAAIEAYRRIGKSEEWIAVRIQSKVVRLRFTGAFKHALKGDPQRWHYGAITDAMRLGLWKRNTNTLRKQLGLKENANLRDHQSMLAVSYELLAETISATELEMNQNLPFETAKHIVHSNSEDVGKHAEATGKRLGIDIATNKPLLKSSHEYPSIFRGWGVQQYVPTLTHCSPSRIALYCAATSIAQSRINVINSGGSSTVAAVP
jgi:hypothetical protein